LRRVAEQQGRNPEELWAIPECPVEVGYLLDWFQELKTGPDHLTFQEIDAWAKLTCNFPTPSEVDVLVRLDRELMTVLKN